MPPEPAAFDEPLLPDEPALPDDFNPEPGWRLTPLTSPLLPVPVPVAPELEVPEGAARRSLLSVAPGEPEASLRRLTDGRSPSRVTPLGPFFVEPECSAPWSERSLGVVGLTCAIALPVSSSVENRMAKDGLCI